MKMDVHREASDGGIVALWEPKTKQNKTKQKKPSSKRFLFMI
jgi:hypothetical protein